MNNNFNMFEQVLDAQKNMFQIWKKAFNPSAEASNDEDDPMDYYKEAMKFNTNMFNNYSGDPNEVFKKIMQSSDVYYNIYKVWEDLHENSVEPTEEAMKEAYEKWTEQYAEYMKKNFIPYIPKPAQNIMEESMSLAESYKTSVNKFLEPWMNSQEDLKDAYLKGIFNNPSGYLDFLKVWKENYEESFGKFINSPTMGIDREFLEKQFESLDKFIRFSVLASECGVNIYKLTQETMKKTLEDYLDMCKEGLQPKTFDEFYKYYTKQIDIGFKKLFFSNEFSKLVGRTVEAMSDFKIEADKLWEEYLSFVPVPKKSDMDSLYKTVYDMKKEVKNIKKEMEELKSSLNEPKGAKKSK